MNAVGFVTLLKEDRCQLSPSFQNRYLKITFQYNQHDSLCATYCGCATVYVVFLFTKKTYTKLWFYSSIIAEISLLKIQYKYKSKYEKGELRNEPTNANNLKKG